VSIILCQLFLTQPKLTQTCVKKFFENIFDTTVSSKSRIYTPNSKKICNLHTKKMGNNTIKLIIAFATISMAGIVITQVYWVGRAFDMEEKQFNQTVHIALQRVSEKMAELNKSTPKIDPVKQITSNYYVVNVNDVIDANILEYYLKETFTNHHLHIDYEYGIYDCSSEQMVYGNYIAKNESHKIDVIKTKLPKWDEYVYYFGVRFPTKQLYLTSQMDIWIFSSVVMVMVMVFFGYTMFVILKQKRLSEVQRDFINNMTHEFKTPISTIAISADLISNPKIMEKPESLLNYANIIKTQNTRLKNQIEKVLQMAMMDKGVLKLSKEQVDLHELVREIVDNNLKADKSIELECQLNAQETLVYADKVHLTNIVYNLLDNAVKYVKGSPKIVISTQNIKNHIILSIRDNGIGIAKEHQKKIFDKFYRVPTGNVHDVKGFGLGLNYVKKIVHAHQWKLKLESELNQGSTFSMVMTLHKKLSPKTESSQTPKFENIP
jgi:two-component system, OmpR family, phosphate regulon sensor histidine kinase PhoR